MESPWYHATIAAGRVAMRALCVRFRTHGTEHLPASGPVVLASTHGSFPDFLLVGRAALRRGRYVRFMSRHDVWDQPVVGRAMDAMRHIPVDRQAPAGALLRARRLLADGQAVGAFPEAGISWSHTVRPLMPGAAALAAHTGAPLVPVAVWGAQRIWTVDPACGGRGRPDLTRGRHVDVAFGAPMRLTTGADPRRATEVLGQRLTELLEELQARPEHRPAPGERAPWYPAHLGGDAPSRAEASRLESVPRSAVAPAWGPPVPEGATTASVPRDPSPGPLRF